MSVLSPIPRSTPVIGSIIDAFTGKKEWTGLLSFDWDNWFREWTGRLDDSPEVLLATQLEDNSGVAVATTSLALSTLSQGLYRVTTYARIAVADGVSSSLTVTLGWTTNAISCLFAGAAMTGDTTATVQSLTFLMSIDQATAITYATTYASNTAAKMKYDLFVTVEAMS